MGRFCNLDLKSVLFEDSTPLGIVYIDLETIGEKQYRLIDDFVSYNHIMAIADVWPSLFCKLVENNIYTKIRVCDIFNHIPIHYINNNTTFTSPEAFGYNYHIEETDFRFFATDFNIDFIESLTDFDFVLNCYYGISFKHKEEYEQALVIKQLMGLK